MEGSRPKTIVKYQGILKRFTEFARSAGVTQLLRVDLMLVDKYRSFRQPDLSTKSMDNEGGLLKSYFGWCVECGLMPTNPLANRKFATPPAKPRGGPHVGADQQHLESGLRCSTDGDRDGGFRWPEDRRDRPAASRGR